MRTLRFTALTLVLALLLSVSPLVTPGLSAQSRPLLRLDLPQLSPGRVLLTGEAASPEPAHITLTLLGEDGSAVTLLDTTAGEAEIRQGVSRITAGVCYTAVLSVGDASVSRRFRALPSDPPAALFSGQTEQDAWVGLYREGVLLASGRADSSGSFTIPYAPEGLCTLRAETGSAVLEEAALVGAGLTAELYETPAQISASLPAGYAAAGLTAAARAAGADTLRVTVTVEEEAARYREAILLRQAARVSRLDLLLEVGCGIPLPTPITLVLPLPASLSQTARPQVTRLVGTEPVPLSAGESVTRVGDLLVLRVRTPGLLAVTGEPEPEPTPEVPPSPSPTDTPVFPTPEPAPEPTPTPALPSFGDTEGHWAEEEIRLAAGLGLFSGTGGDRFDPEGSMTRAMFVTVLWRMAGTPEPASPGRFADVVPGSWYAGAVAWAVEQGIVQGRSPTRFAPEEPITREQMALMLWRWAGTPEPSGPPDCGDGDRISRWARDAVSWAWETGLLRGSGGMFRPEENASRAQGAVLLLRFYSRSR